MNTVCPACNTTLVTQPAEPGGLVRCGACGETLRVTRNLNLVLLPVDELHRLESVDLSHAPVLDAGVVH